MIAAPERGLDLNVKSVAERIMKLAVKNSPAFIRANANRAEKLAVIEALKVEIPALEKELADAQLELEVAKVESESRVVDPIDWSKAENLDTQAEIRALGIAMIDDVGNENVYVIKDGMPYYFKPVNTDNYAKGEHDFSGDDAYGENEQSVNVDGLDYTPIDLNADNAKLEWDKAISETNGNEFEAAKNVYQKTLQGHYVNTSIGKVLISGLGWQEMKQGLKRDSLRAKTIPYIAAILKEGSVGDFDPNNKPEKKPDVTGYYPFTKTLEIDEKLVTAELKVEQKQKGEFVYYLRASEDAVLDGTNENAGLLRFLPDSPALQRSEVPTLDSSVEPNTGGVNIIILKVTDLEGNEITELEDKIEHVWTDAPVNNYVVSKAANNASKIRPLPGKSFSENDFKLLIDWIKANGWSARKEKNYVYAIGEALKDKWDDIPDANRTTQHDIKVQKYADKEAQTEAETQETLKHPAAQWIAGVFGDDFKTPWIRASLVRFITGEEGETGVMLDHAWLKGILALGATPEQLDGMSRMDILEYIKSKYQGTNEQTNEQAEVEKEAEAAGTEGGGAKGKIESVEELVDIALSRKDGNKAFAEIGEITQDVAEKVKQVTGIDVTGWVHGIDEAAIRHIIKEHGDNLVEESRGQVAVTPQDISRINEIVQNPDSIEKGDPLPNGNETVIYKKTIEGTSIYVQEMRDGRRKLTAKTLWKVRAVPPATVETGLVHTSETSSTQPPQDDKNIPQPKNNAITSVEIEKELEDLKPLIGTRAFDDKIDPLIEKIFAAGLMPDYEPQLVELDRLHGNAKVAKHRGI